MSLDIKELFKEAVIFENEKKFEDAIDTYKKIIRINRINFESWLNLGSLYLRLNQFQKALICFESCNKLKDDHRSFFNLGLVHFKLKNYSSAIENYLKSISLNPEHLSSYLVGAYTYSELNNIENAIELLKKGKKYFPKNDSLLSYLAVAYFSQDNYTDCISIIKDIESFNPKNPYINKLKIKMALKENLTKESLNTIKSAMKKDPIIFSINDIMNMPENLNVIQNISTKKRELISKKEKTKEDYLNLSLTSFFMGNPNAAIGFLEQLLPE